MRRVSLGVALSVWAFRFGAPLWAWAAPDSAAQTVETLVRGLEARQEERPFSGRVITAYRTSSEFARDKLVWEPLDAAADPSGGILDLAITDFASADRCWRVEVRQVVSSGLGWWGFQAPLGLPGVRKPLRADDLYQLEACDGSRVLAYDRTVHTVTRRALRETDTQPAGTLSPLRDAFLGSLPRWVPALMRARMHMEVKGKEVADGVPCHVLVAVGGHPHPRGYIRLWIAPDRDFGVVRFEHVETNAEGQVTSCDIARRSDWVHEAAAGLWVPRLYEIDCFQYRERGMGFNGWAWTQVHRAERLSGAPADAAPPWVPPLAFDTRVVDSDTGEAHESPCHDVKGLLATVHFGSPDPFGELVAEADPDVVFR